MKTGMYAMCASRLSPAVIVNLFLIIVASQQLPPDLFPLQPSIWPSFVHSSSAVCDPFWQPLKRNGENHCTHTFPTTKLPCICTTCLDITLFFLIFCSERHCLLILLNCHHFQLLISGKVALLDVYR